MKTFVRSLIFGCLVLMLPCIGHGQEVNNLYMAGVSFNNSATPPVAGTAMYAHAVSHDTAPGMFAFSVYDALPNKGKPFTVTSNIGVGIAQKVFDIAGHDVFVPSSAGISYSGTNVGWAWSTGAGVPFKIKETSDGGAWYVMPIVRVVKSSVSNGTGYQPIVSLTFGYGK